MKSQWILVSALIIKELLFSISAIMGAKNCGELCQPSKYSQYKHEINLRCIYSSLPLDEQMNINSKMRSGLFCILQSLPSVSKASSLTLCYYGGKESKKRSRSCRVSVLHNEPACYFNFGVPPTVKFTNNSSDTYFALNLNSAERCSCNTYNCPVFPFTKVVRYIPIPSRPKYMLEDYRIYSLSRQYQANI